MSTEPKKRGRKKKIDTTIDNVIVDQVLADQVLADQANVVVDQATADPAKATTDPVVVAPKKRGRKPKGGKIIPIEKDAVMLVEQSKNIILHLKCSLNDLKNYSDNNFVAAYDTTNSVFELYDQTNNINTSIDESLNHSIPNIGISTRGNNMESKAEVFNKVDAYNKSDAYNKEEVLNKINELKLNLSKNNISDKRSACFWCTCDFHNPPIFIPTREKNDGYEVYGCFCTPECSVAYLMNENIDASVKFERYQLMNFIYGKSLEYKTNIKPAPDPHYLLDKYYGNLTIEEYRGALQNNNFLIFVDKPLTHVFPEMFIDNHDYTLMKDSNMANNSSLSQYKIKKASVGEKKKKTKSDIVKEKFGMA